MVVCFWKTRSRYLNKPSSRQILVTQTRAVGFLVPCNVGFRCRKSMASHLQRIHTSRPISSSERPLRLGSE